jgi:hypothetical protein
MYIRRTGMKQSDDEWIQKFIERAREAEQRLHKYYEELANQAKENLEFFRKLFPEKSDK